MRRKNSSKGLPGSVAALLRMALPKGAEEKLALPEIRKKWEIIVGPILAKKTLPDDVDKGVLLVKAESPSAAKVLSMRGASVARAASKHTGLPITSIRVMVGKSSPLPTAPSRKISSRVVPRKEDVDRTFEEMKQNFSPEREQLARRFASLMTLYRMRFPDK